MAHAIFEFARITSEVRFHYWGSEAEIMLDRLALGGTKPIRPDTIAPFGSVAAHCPVGGQGGG